MPLINEEGLVVQLIRQSRSLLGEGDSNRQRRRNKVRKLQTTTGGSTLRPLYVTIQVTGFANEPTSVTTADPIDTTVNDNNNSTEPQTLTNLTYFDFDYILQQIFIEKQPEYVEALQISGDLFFVDLEQANVLLDSTIGDIGFDVTGSNNSTATGNDGGDDMDKESVMGDKDNGSNTPPTGSPPTPAPWIDNYTQQQSDTDAVLSKNAIIGIAVGGGVLLLVIMLCLLWHCGCFRKRSIRNGTETKAKSPIAAVGATSSMDTTTKKVPSTPQRNKPWNRRRQKNNGITGPIDSMAEQHLISTDNSSNKPDDDEIASDLNSDADLESQAMYSYNPRGDSGSVYTANNSIMLSGGAVHGGFHGNQSYYGNDNMSYAYSLEAGIEASIIDGVMINNMTMNQSIYDDSVRSRIPIREIPQISLENATNAGDAEAGQTSASSRTQNGRNTGSKNNDANKTDGFGDTQIETTPSDLKLTDSELAMLPSNLRSGDEEDEGNEGDDDTKVNFAAQNVTTRKVLAPSGKLGIVIDTTVEGPVVHNINEGSRLQGKLFPGDIIVAIDDVDTRAMSASAITTLMVKTANQNRTLTIRGGSESAK